MLAPMASPAQPFVGREFELARLESALDLLDSGTPACIAIEGEPGIGKTRLLGQLRRRAEHRHHVVLEGRAAEFDRDVPFGVVVDALDAYLASHDPKVLERWEPEAREELGAIFPSLRESSWSAPAGAGEERYRAHRAMRWLLERLSASRRLVIVLDDVHWADAASIELIGSLLRRGPDAPVLLALAYRPAQAPGRLSSALAVPGVSRIGLDPLSEAEAAELLSDLDAQSRATVYVQGGGNPFYLEQLARVGARRRGPGASATADAGVPRAVAAALGEELEALSPPARRLLDAAAVAGEPFEPNLAADIAQQPHAEGLAALDELLAVDLVRPTEVPRRFAFRHALVHRAVYEAAPGGWRLAAHARAAAALAARGAPAAERARHVEYSATPSDEDAIAVLLAAGHATASRAPAAAVHWFEAALRLLPADDREREVDVRKSLASSLRALGELERCRSTLLEAIELLPATDHARRVELTASCAAVENWLGHNDDAHRRLLDAWDRLPHRDGAEAAALAIELAVDGLYALDFEQVFELGTYALECARRLDDAALIATAASALALGKLAYGDVDAARAHRDEAAERIDRLPDADLAPRLEALYYLGWAESFMEHVDEAAGHFARGIAISRATGDGRLLVPLTLGSAVPHEARGQLAESIEICEAAVEAARLTDNPQYLFWALWELGWRHYLAGDLDAAADACEQSGRAGRRLAGSFMRSGSGEPGWTLGAVQIKRGDVERGLETLLAGVGGPDLPYVTPLERCWAREHLALAELARGRPEAAEVHACRAEEDATRLGLGVAVAIAARTRAAVLLHAGRPAEAALSAQRAVEAATGARRPLDAAWSRSLLGRALLAAGERDRAVETLRAAERELDLCGSQRERDAARRELRRLGVRTEPRARGEAGTDVLTTREREIAELVTARKTNREIADHLVLSGKTVETHMRNIFAKLGVSSRVAVAHAIERQREQDG